LKKNGQQIKKMLKTRFVTTMHKTLSVIISGAGILL